jgi:peptide-methionine (S)-S-oxide reductase
MPETYYAVATLGAGCFWCVEAIFQQLRGVQKVVPGYAGGTVEHPTYKQVCTGTTGHAEAVQITFDPAVISFEDLLYVFWRVHDPTTLNRQGADIGPQYRSVIFYHDDAQKATAEQSKQATEAANVWPHSIVTEISPFRNFYPAEPYHRNYYLINPEQPYCRFVIDPKIQKFQHTFQDKLRKETA